MRRSVSLGRVRGVPIEMRLSAFILLGLLTIMMVIAQGDVLGIPIGFGSLSVPFALKVVLGALCALIIFLGVLLHEIAHCITAKLLGHKVRGITILMFSGEVDIPRERYCELMKGEGVIAFMGPASNLAMGGAFLFISYILIGGASAPSQDIAVTCLGVLGFYNVLLGAFNLLPGRSLDGGTILRSFLRKRMDLDRTNLTVVKVCHMSAICIGAFGIWSNELAITLVAVLLYLITYLEDPEFYYKIE